MEEGLTEEETVGVEGVVLWLLLPDKVSVSLRATCLGGQEETRDGQEGSGRGSPRCGMVLSV